MMMTMIRLPVYIYIYIHIYTYPYVGDSSPPRCYKVSTDNYLPTFRKIVKPSYSELYDYFGFLYFRIVTKSAVHVNKSSTDGTEKTK